MQQEFGELYPLHLGVTEAGDGEDGRIKSAIGIGSLLEDGIGDTIRVSLTEDPEFEIPVCKDLRARYTQANNNKYTKGKPYHPLWVILPAIRPSNTSAGIVFPVGNIGGKQVPVVIADLSQVEKIQPADLAAIGYRYDEALDKWHIADAAADYVFTGHQLLDFPLPGTLKQLLYPAAWDAAGGENTGVFPLFHDSGYASATNLNQPS